MLHHQHGVAQVAQVPQGREQPLVVPVVQPDRGLVQDVEHAHEPAADLRGEPDPLRLTSRERRRRTAEGEVFQAHVLKEPQAIVHLLEDRPRDVAVEARPAVAAERQSLEEGERITDRQLHHIAQAAPAHQHREALGAQPSPAARGARLFHHVFLELLAHAVGRGLTIAPLDVSEDAFPRRLVFAVPPLAVVLIREGAARCPLQDHLAHRGGEVLPGRSEVELEGARERRQDHLAEIAARLAPRQDHAFEDREARVAQNEIGVDLAARAEPGTRRAGAERRVERELPRLELRKREAARGAGVALGEDRHAVARRASLSHDLDHTLRRLERRLDRVREPAPVSRPDHEPVHDYGDRVVLTAVQLGNGGQIVALPVHPHAHEALLACRLEQVPELALASPHQRRQDLDLRPLGPGDDEIGDLRRALALDRRAVVRAVGHPDTRPEQPEVVVHLGDRPHRGSRVRAGGLLLDRNRGRQALDGVHVRLFHQPEELPGVRRQRLHITSLALGVDGVERERGLARARESCDHRQRVAGDLDGNVLEVVLAGPADDEGVAGHRLVGLTAGGSGVNGGGAAKGGMPLPPLFSCPTYVHFLR